MKNIKSSSETRRLTHSQSKYPFLDDLNLSDDVVSRLSQSLSRTSAGSKLELVTPLALNVDPEQILAGWDRIFNSPEHKRLITIDLDQLEASNRDKFGPRSIAEPWFIRSAGVREGFELEKLSFKSELTPTKLGRTPRLRPTSLAEAAKFVKKSTNSGLPAFRRKRDVLKETVDNHASLLAQEYPCVVFTRTQEGGKTRTVWGYPLADTLEEARFYRPLLGYQRTLSWRSALAGPDAIDKKVGNMILKSRESGRTLLSIDFSKFDQTVKSTLQELSFQYIKDLFQAGESRRSLDNIARRFNTIGLVTPEGVWYGQHGVPSGSTFTNEVDSIAQYIVASEFLDDMDLFDIQGDDGCYCLTDGQIDALIDKCRQFGLVVNEEKSYRNNRFIIYLQKLFSIDYLKDGNICGIYPTYRALSRLVYQERFTNFVDEGIKGEDFYSIRAISILENCKHHPLFKQLVKYVLSLDKYKLQYSQDGLVNYVKKINPDRGVDTINNQYGDNLAGIAKFETVRVINSLL